MLVLSLAGLRYNVKYDIGRFQEQNKMTAHAQIPFETLVEIVEELPVEQQQLLLTRIQGHIKRKNLTAEEKMRLLRSIQIDAKVIQEPSPRREDWYDDDGR